MGTDFEISIQKKGEDVYLKLRGGFDGTSAYELLYILQTHCNSGSQVFIHTSCLGTIYPFGLDVFRNNFDMLKGKSLDLVFTGEHASLLAPEKEALFDLTISTIPPVSQSEKTIQTSLSTKTINRVWHSL
jgi:anti-anti-sigma regulatory factor